MQLNASRAELFRSMLIDEEELLKSVLQKAREVFQLDSRGNVMFNVPRKSLTNKQLIGVYLLSVYIASNLEDIESITVPVASADDLATMTGIDQKAVRARLSDLKKDLIAESPERGLYQITIPGASTLLDEILENLEGVSK